MGWTGRPRHYRDDEVDRFEAVLVAYFEQCAKEKRPPLFVGMANALGMAKRTLVDYVHRKGFDDVMHMARQHMEEQVIGRLFDPKVPTAGVIFLACNNFGETDYRQPSQIIHTGPGNGPIQHHHTAPMSAEIRNQLDAHIAETASGE